MTAKLYRVWLSHATGQGQVTEARRVAARSPGEAHTAALTLIRDDARCEDSSLYALGLDLDPRGWRVDSIEEVPSLVTA